MAKNGKRKVKLRKHPPAQQVGPGRPRKLTREVLVEIYTMRLGGFWPYQIAQVIETKYGWTISGRSVDRACHYMRENLPRRTPQENVVEAMDACRQRMQDLTIRKEEFAGRNQNAYIGAMNAIREESKLLHQLQGVLREWVELDIGGKTMKGLHDILEGRWRPKLPEDIPEAARRAITGEGVGEEEKLDGIH